MGALDMKDVHIKVPAGFRTDHPDWCPYGDNTTWHLLCSFMVLKQAAAIYYDTMKTLVLNAKLSNGEKFRVSESDPCLFEEGAWGTARTLFSPSRKCTK